MMLQAAYFRDDVRVEEDEVEYKIENRATKYKGMNFLLGIVIDCFALILLYTGRGLINKMIIERIQQLQLKKSEFDYDLTKIEVIVVLLKMKRYSDIFSLLGFALIVLSGLLCFALGIFFQLVR